MKYCYFLNLFNISILQWPHIRCFVIFTKTFATAFKQSLCEISIKHKCHADNLLSCDLCVMASAHSCMSYLCPRGLKLSASKCDTQTNDHDLLIWLSQLCGFFSSPGSLDTIWTAHCSNMRQHAEYLWVIDTIMSKEAECFIYKPEKRVFSRVGLILSTLTGFKHLDI